MKAKLGNTELELDKADSPEKARKGLLGLKFYPRNKAMLFHFPLGKMELHTVGMEMPIDILVLDSDRRVIQAYKKVMPGVNALRYPGTYALEMASGEIDRLNLKKGMKLSYDRKAIMSNKSGGKMEGDLMILGPDGEVQKKATSGSRIVSRKETKKLIESASLLKNEEDLINLGNLMYKVIKGQDSREPEYVGK